MKEIPYYLSFAASYHFVFGGLVFQYMCQWFINDRIIWSSLLDNMSGDIYKKQTHKAITMKLSSLRFPIFSIPDDNNVRKIKFIKKRENSVSDDR